MEQTPLEQPEISPAPAEKPQTHSDKKRMILIAATIPTVLALAFAIYLAALDKSKPPEIPTYTISKSEEPKPWIKHIDNRLNFSLEYPSDTKFRESRNQGVNPETFEVLFMGQNQKKELEQEENLQDGYIFRILVHKKLQNTDIDDLINKRRQTYVSRCPKTSNVSQIKDIAVSDKTGKTFEAVDCVLTYRETFTLDRGTVFELLQIYKGDLGFRQAYKSRLQDIQDKFRFTNLPTEDILWIKVEDTSAKISFEHPSLNVKCCNIRPPKLSKAKAIGTFADVGITRTNASFDGFGIYIDENKSSTFEEYLENQKALLIEDYRVIIGRNPTALKETQVIIDGSAGTSLKGYAWWIDEIIYIQHKYDSNGIVIILKSEKEPGSFDETFGKMLSTFKFID